MGITVISGGQTGVDTGGIDAAKVLGTEFADWEAMLPAGFKREKPMPDWMIKEKGKRVRELKQATQYEDRTKHVVSRAVACLVIEHPDKETPGTKLTLSLCKRNGGVQLWRFQNVQDKAKWKAESHAVAYWLRSLLSSHGPDITLMVAGPREGKWGAGETTAFALVTTILRAVKEDK